MPVRFRTFQNITSFRYATILTLSHGKKKAEQLLDCFLGRGERTRTFGLTVPNRARYQLRHTPTGVNTWMIIA